MMKLLVSISLLAMALIVTGNALAHAVVTEHTLHFEQSKPNTASKIELTFNSRVELGLSQVFLVSKGDKQSLLKISKGQKQGNVIVAIPPLTAGEYALLYRIFAADGHLTEDVIYFQVKP